MSRIASPLRPPIREENPLLEELLTDALQAYLVGDYRAAAERLLDAKAIQDGRIDWSPFEALLAVLESLLAHAELPAQHGGPNPPRAVRS